MIVNIRAIRSLPLVMAFSISFLLHPVRAGGQARGSVCVGSNSAIRPTGVSPGQMYNPATLSVRIDKGKVVLWPHKDCLKIEGLEITQRHLLIVISDGKPIQSFWFRFADYKSSELCISFDGYQGVQVQVPKEARWCKCK